MFAGDVSPHLNSCAAAQELVGAESVFGAVEDTVRIVRTIRVGAQDLLDNVQLNLNEDSGLEG